MKNCGENRYGRQKLSRGGCSCKSSIIPDVPREEFRSLCHRKAKSALQVFHKRPKDENALKRPTRFYFLCHLFRSSTPKYLVRCYRQSSIVPVSPLNISRKFGSTAIKDRLQSQIGVSDGSSSTDSCRALRSAPPSATTVALFKQ